MFNIWEVGKAAGGWMLNNLSLEGLISLPALMVGFLVAIAIFIFENSGRGLEIDMPTIIARVVKVNQVLVGILLVSILVVCWPGNPNTNTVYTLPYLGIVYIAGLTVLTLSLVRSFKWARSIETGADSNFRTNARRLYLVKLKDNEKRDAWEKIWNAGDGIRSSINTRQLIKLFVLSVKKTHNKDEVAAWLIEDFISNLDTINLSDPVIMQELVILCMGDAYAFTEGDTADKRKTDEELRYSMDLRRLYFKILEQTLKVHNLAFFTLVQTTRTYIRENNLDEAYFVKVFAPNFFEYFQGDVDYRFIWDSFPDEWTITMANLTSPERNAVSFAWLNAYGNWLNGLNLYGDAEDFQFNNTADEVSRHLLPTADPIYWAKLYSFHWAPYAVHNGELAEHAQVRNYVERHVTFGLVGHVVSFFAEGEGDAMNQINNTTNEVLEIAARTTIFPAFHNSTTMAKYIKAIKQLKVEFSDDDDKLRKLVWLDATLKSIRKRIRNIHSS